MNTKFYVTVINEDTLKEGPRFLVKMLLPALMKGQNYLADKCNPQYAEWNETFDKLYPDNKEDCSDPDSKYMDYIRKKHNEILKELKPDNIFVKRYYSGRQANLCVETYFGNYSFILSGKGWCKLHWPLFFLSDERRK